MFYCKEEAGVEEVVVCVAGAVAVEEDKAGFSRRG